MKLSKDNYSGDIHKKVYVSAEKGRKHIAQNSDGQYEVRHYRLDGDIINNALCCDYLLVNDSKRNAYYIELKGSDLTHAIAQVEAGEKICRDFLRGYSAFYRIVTSKTRTQELKSSKYRHFECRVGRDKIKQGNRIIEEIL